MKVCNNVINIGIIIHDYSHQEGTGFFYKRTYALVLYESCLSSRTWQNIGNVIDSDTKLACFFFLRFDKIL